MGVVVRIEMVDIVITQRVVVVVGLLGMHGRLNQKFYWQAAVPVGL